MNVERAFRIVNEASWGKQFIKNATEFHNGLEMFKMNMEKLNVDKFVKAAFIKILSLLTMTKLVEYFVLYQ